MKRIHASNFLVVPVKIEYSRKLSSQLRQYSFLLFNYTDIEILEEVLMESLDIFIPSPPPAPLPCWAPQPGPPLHRTPSWI